MKQESDRGRIIPQRYIPFDLGANIEKKDEENLERYFLENKYIVNTVAQLFNSLSFGIRYVVNIGTELPLRLYVYSYGIAVFCFEDSMYDMNEKYAVDYCTLRKKAHSEILEKREKNVTRQIETIIKQLRKIIFFTHKDIRKSANSDWENHGLSYVMTVSYIMTESKEYSDYGKLSDIDKKNLQIMLQPSLAHLEDTLSLHVNNNGSDPYDLDLNVLDEPKNWIKSSDCSIFISWAAVIVCLRDLSSSYAKIVEYMEIDLQAMWFYTYCQYDNLKTISGPKLTSRELKKQKYNFQKRFSEFKGDNDASLPTYISEIKEELVRTSGIDDEKNSYMDYIDFCIDEAESIETEQQKKYSIMNEILLFIIAFLQIAPMLYSIMIGGYEELHMMPIAVLTLIAILAIAIIVKKD